MIRQSKSPHRLGRPALFAVLLGAAALPLAPTLAGQEEPVPEAPVTEEKRDVIVRQAEPPSADLVTAEVIGEVTVSVSPDVETSIDQFVVSTSEDVVTDKIFDARTGNTIEVRGKSMRIVQGSDLERARAEVQAARANLQAATRRLKEIEAKFGNNAKFGWEGSDKPGKGDKAYSADAKPKMKTAEIRFKDAPSSSSYKAAPPTESRLSVDGKPSDQDRRMQKLEDKMDQLGQMLDEMRREREERGHNNADKGPTVGLQVR